MNIVRDIRERAHGNRIAICEGERETSFDELFASVDVIANWLKQAGLNLHGEVPRIGVRAPNGSAYIAISLAVLSIDACFVPIPDELTEAERKRLISDTALHAVIIFGEGGFQLPADLGTAEIHRIEIPTPLFPVSKFEQLNPAFIRFSSGTTGQSKGVVISHKSLKERILAANRGLQLSPGERVLWTLPMAHHFAVTIILYLYQGVTTVVETTHQPVQLFRAAATSKTHLLYGSPFHFAQLAQCEEAGPLPNLRMAISTASALPETVAQAFQKRFKIPLTQAFGIIEVGLPILNSTHHHDCPTTLGNPLPDYEVRLADDGELFLKGPGMLDAYLLPWKERAEILDQGFFATGDIAAIKPDGTVHLKGRKKAVINVAGMKVFPEEIETVLNTHPAILRSEVRAKTHPTLGSFPHASIITKGNDKLPSPRELRNFCAKQLASYKIPAQFEQVKNLHTTASGKIKRHPQR